MNATTARFLYDTLRTTIIVVALALAAYTMAGGFDTPGNVAGSVTQTGSIVHEWNANDAHFNDDAQLDTTQVGEGR